VEQMADGRPAAPSPPPAADEAALSDRVLARVGGDRQLLLEISRLFVDDAPGHLRRIQEALDARDGESLRRAAHTLKGAAANFDASRLVDAARSLEELGRTGKLSDAEGVWTTVRLETDRLVELLQRLAATAN
jgi:two-component system sensor histidine kinase/response regulator